MSARPAVFATAAVPRTIGKYVVSHLIGQGSMGVVYKAVDPQIQRSVAVKTIRQPLLLTTGDGDAALRFRQEAQAAGRLSHPNIVSIYEYGESESGTGAAELYIAMECVDGPSLHELLSRGVRLDVPDVVAVMLQVLDALDCAHRQGVWHCDIKPGNLLLTPDGRIKVTDFGIARVDATELTLRNAVYGSPGYMAPELYAGGAPDQRVDVFSCGVLLYQLLTGTAPFVGSASEVMVQVLRQDPLPPSMVGPGQSPPAFDTIVVRALAKHPEDRYASALEMRQALLAVLPISGTAPLAVSAAGLAGLRGAQALLPPGLATLPPPPPSGRGPATWDPQALAHVEALLRPHLGPVSKYAVREAARRSSSLSELASVLAARSLEPNERVAFIAQVGQLSGAREEAPTVVQPSVHTAGDAPLLNQTPLQPGTVEQAARLLAHEIGPIALLHARRAAAGATSCEQFFAALVERAGAGVNRQGLLAALWRTSRV